MSHTYDVPRLPARMRTDRKTGARYRDGSVPQDVARPLFQAPLLFLKPLLIASLLIAVPFGKRRLRSLVAVLPLLLLYRAVQA